MGFLIVINIGDGYSGFLLEDFYGRDSIIDFFDFVIVDLDDFFCDEIVG